MLISLLRFIFFYMTLGSREVFLRVHSFMKITNSFYYCFGYGNNATSFVASCYNYYGVNNVTFPSRYIKLIISTNVIALVYHSSTKDIVQNVEKPIKVAYSFLHNYEDCLLFRFTSCRTSVILHCKPIGTSGNSEYILSMLRPYY